MFPRKSWFLLALALLCALLLALPAGGEGTAQPAQPVSPLPTPTPFWDARLTELGISVVKPALPAAHYCQVIEGRAIEDGNPDHANFYIRTVNASGKALSSLIFISSLARRLDFYTVAAADPFRWAGVPTYWLHWPPADGRFRVYVAEVGYESDLVLRGPAPYNPDLGIRLTFRCQ
jgi:hypothetical protein